jgi:hypothetical protein
MESINTTHKTMIQQQSLVPSVISTTVNTRQPFAGVLEKILATSEITSGFNTHLSNIQARVLSGVTFTPRELLLLQMQMGRFNMQVELVSKIADSATSSLRKIQNS